MNFQQARSCGNGRGNVDGVLGDEDVNVKEDEGRNYDWDGRTLRVLTCCNASSSD